MIDLRWAYIRCMSLPPNFLDELRTRVSLSQVVGRKVMWDQRKSNQGKGDMWAPCPFHQEKSASFHVDDRKGFYYCFGCHAKGDAISFIRETENVDFMEAVRILASEAGMQMPARDAAAAQKAQKRDALSDITEAAVKFYRMQLGGAAATAARAYLDKRGMNAATRDRFEIGFAPEGNALLAHLTQKGIPAEKVIEAGLAATPDDGRAPYDRFRGRIMFPIRDPRGRCISFGGRAMDPNARAKYLNGPESPLFDKGRSLYNQGPAREAAGKGQTLVVAEGYMDVIALSAAGFNATVAPLGTAVTETQLQMLWRISPEPVIALDGDKAGIRAAMRVIDIALPLLEAGQALRFAILPEGLDPDDLIKAKGASAMQEVLDGAVPMVNLLWQRETEGKIFDSPERRAGLDKALREKIRLIRDPSIRRHYGDAVQALREDLFGTRRRDAGNEGFQKRPWVAQGQQGKGNWKARGAGKWQAAPVPVSSTVASALASGGDAHTMERLREGVILATLICTPSLIEEFEAQLERMRCLDAAMAAVRDMLLRLDMAALDPGSTSEPASASRDTSPDMPGLSDMSDMQDIADLPDIADDSDMPEIPDYDESYFDDRFVPEGYEGMEDEAEMRDYDPYPDAEQAGEKPAPATGSALPPLYHILAQQVGAGALEMLFALPHVRIAPTVRRWGDEAMARMTLAEEMAKLHAERGLLAEIEEAEQELSGVADEAVTWRLQQAAEAHHRATRSEQEDNAHYDTGPNGAHINREERNAFDDLLRRIGLGGDDGKAGD